MRTIVKVLRKLLNRPPVACAFISLIVFAAVAGLHAYKVLQKPELIAYDYLVRKRMKPQSVDDRMVLIGMTEQDLRDYGYPFSDRLLAELLRKIDSQKPAAIGLDLYRDLPEPRIPESIAELNSALIDLPEPRNRESIAELNSALIELESVIAIRRYGQIDAPPALNTEKGRDRISVNNLPKDGEVDGVYRRGYLFWEEEETKEGKKTVIPSFSLSLATAFLAEHYVGQEDSIDADGNMVLRLGKTIIPRLSPNAGGYVNLRVPSYQYLVDFESPCRFLKAGAKAHQGDDQSGEDTPHDYSFGDVMRHKVPENALKGKIVFVATVMQSIKDSNPTPIHDNLRGVQQHMMMTHQLLEIGFGRLKPMSVWPDWAEFMCIAAAALAGGVVGLFLHSPWRFAPAISIVLALIAAGGWWGFQSRIWIPVVAPILACTVAAALVVSVVAYFEGAERGMMTTIVSKHMSGPVLNALMAQREQFLEGGRLKPQRVVATVLFTDLKGFSTTSEKMDPATLMDWMNDYFNGIASHVDECGGIINKFIGDAIMGVFGVPVARTTEAEMDLDAKNAVECALAMRAALQKLNAGWLEEGRPTTAMRIGIHTGPLVSGSVGSEARLEFTVLGDTVNTAARLEGAGKDFAEDVEAAACTILISDATCKRLHGGYVTRLLGPLSLKGKADQVIVHSVISSTKELTAQ